MSMLYGTKCGFTYYVQRFYQYLHARLGHPSVDHCMLTLSVHPLRVSDSMPSPMSLCSINWNCHRVILIVATYDPSHNLISLRQYLCCFPGNIEFGPNMNGNWLELAYLLLLLLLLLFCIYTNIIRIVQRLVRLLWWQLNSNRFRL